MEQMQFKISSALKDLVGKDLITNENIAIFELVKNSYDAYATKVEITFSDDAIIIADNGKGMTFNDLKDKWLFLGYSAKKDGTEDVDINKQQSYRDKIRRYYAGAKGIGRFSCDRLGKRLLLTTKSGKSKSTEIIVVNWSDFEFDQKKEFAEINIGHKSLNNHSIHFPENKQTGTVLEITELNNESIFWNRKRILELKRSLEKLINPFSETDDFSIEIICEREKEQDEIIKAQDGYDRNIVNGVLKNSIAQILKLKTTQIDVRLADNVIYTTLSDRGIEVYKIKENNIKFPALKHTNINLYFLNRSAKINFTRLMGIEPKNYGSVFLFRNGFRIMPFGDPGDDSWSLDYRSQQGHSRFLGTRDLFGRVDVLTDNINELKEVSSRDGGLIETETSKQLFQMFEVAHRRLERYVSGVLWGEAFLRKDYFSTETEGLNKRKELLDHDREEDTPNFVLKSSIGSKIDFIQLIKTLTKERNVEIISYNADLANIFTTSDIDSIKPQFISDLEKIAYETNDSSLLFTIDEAKRRINELRQEKADAEQKAYNEEQKRIQAEEHARRAELNRIEAEKQRRIESEKKRIALLQAKEAELKRREEEILRKEAEQRKLEEEAKRKKVENELEREKKQGIFQRSIIGREKEQILGLQHQINHSSSRVKNNIKQLLLHISRNNIAIDSQMQKYISIISLESAKIESLSNFVTNANFDLKASEITQDIGQFIKEYINEIYLPDVPVLSTSLNINILYTNSKWIISFRPLEITTLIDNFVQNAEKAGARNITFDLRVINNRFQILISNDGKAIPLEHIPRIFELGFTTTNGSGIGLFNVKSVVDRLNGKIEVCSQDDKETLFIITI